MGIFMPEMCMAGQERGPRSTGEKRPHAAAASGGQAAHTAPPCDLCALLLGQCRKPSNRRHAPSGPDRGLRIALLANDKATYLAAWEMVEAQRDGWSLDTYHPCCHAPSAARLTQKSRRSGAEAGHASGIPPDIILLGLAGSDPSQYACVRKLKALSPAVPVVIISGRCDGRLIVQACLAGADGWLLNSVAPAKLARVISSAAQGVPALCEEAAGALVHFLHRTGISLYAPDLTAREQEIVGCLPAMLSDKEMSDRLSMNRQTLHSHLGHIFKKLGVHNRRQALRKLLGRRRLTIS
jgi:DNA-binding NarL/FixJ family response regulator